jgi:tetratricopeptide (TPR) repeat protein
MNEALTSRRLGGPIETLALLNRLIRDYPGYAEAWNQRATMYYVLGNFEASIADCEKVLELEPRHFGALSGRSLMYLQLGRRAQALRDMAAALAIHPFLTERRLFPELEQEMTRI